MKSVQAEGGVYLTHYLAPLAPFLARSDVTDIYVNRAQEMWIETLGGAIERHEVPDMTARALLGLAEQVAALNHQGISREHPLLSAVLPDGARIQFIAPPATRNGMALAVRKHQARGLTLDDYAANDALETARAPSSQRNDAPDQTLSRLHANGDVSGLLRHAVRNRSNILVSGGTSTGKTTFLGALLREIPQEERLILIEDTPELDITHDNALGLVAARSALGEAVVNIEDLLNASLRMRPDRIILGELRGPEAFTFLRAINTGHPGSMTTVHADSPRRAIEQIALLVLQSGTRLDRDAIVHYVRSSIDVFVQLGRTGGRRHVEAVTLGSEMA